MKQKRLEGLLVPSVVAGVVAGVLLLSVGGGSVCVGEDKTGAAGPHMSRQDANEDRSNAAAVPDVVPQVAECAELLFEADFSHGNVPEQWIPLHGTQWSVVEGSLEGRPSTKSFQTKRIAAGNASHSGKTPSSRLLVPVDDCVLLFRFQLVDGLSGVHFGFNDGSFKTGTGHVCRFTVSSRKGQALVKDRNVTLKGDEDETLVTDSFNVKANTWYWMMLEIIGDEMVAQVSGGPILRAKNARFDIAKDQINLPTRGGGVVRYDDVKIWRAK